MKRFSFRLEPLLIFRSEKEGRAVMDQALAQKEYREQVEILEEVDKNLKNARDSGVGRITADQCLARSVYIDYLSSFKSRQQEAVEKSLGELEKRREAAIEARRERLVLEKLKDNMRRRHMEKVDRWENKTTDDQCTALTHRKQGTGVGD